MYVYSTYQIKNKRNSFFCQPFKWLQTLEAAFRIASLSCAGNWQLAESKHPTANRIWSFHHLILVNLLLLVWFWMAITITELQ